MSNNMMAKVRALLDTAESFETEGNREAAATYRTKAEELMVKYRIEEEELIARDQTALLPEAFEFHLTRRSPYVNQYLHLFHYIAAHTGIRYSAKWTYDVEGNAQVTVRGAGYASDNEYAELLYTAARLVFNERLEPRIKPDMSDQENAYRLRSAGIERIRIAEMLWGNTDKVFMARVGRLYKAECQARGEEPALSGRGVTGAAYREQYAEQFVYTFTSRLRQAQDAAGRNGGGLVLAGRSDRVDAKFYEMFPELAPNRQVTASTSHAERCERCAKAKRGFCNEHSAKGVKSPRGRDYYSAAAERGRAAGSAAARAVDIRGAGGAEGIGS